MESEWPERPVSELCELIVDCVNKTAPIVDYETPYKMIRTTNVRNGRIGLSGCRYVEEEIFQKWTRRAQVLKGDILLTREAPMGEVGLVRDNDTIFLGQRLMQYRANPKILDSRYLLYSFLSPALQHQFFVHEGTGSVVSHIRVPDCLNFLLKVPPIEEQKAIAHILGSLDDKIELNRRMNTTLEAMAQALFKSWFVDFDPVIDNALAAGQPIPEPLQERAEARAALGDQRQPLPEAIRQQFPNRFVCNEDMGWVPEGWNMVPLTEFGEIICGKTPPKSNAEYFGEEIPFIKIPDMHNEMFVIKTGEYLSKSGASFQKNKFIPRGSVCVSCIATVGKVVITTQKSQTNQQINSIVPKYKYVTPYLYFYMLTLNKLFHDLASGGSTTLNMNTGIFSKIEIIHPNIEVLNVFFNQTKALTQKIEQNLLATETLCNIRDTLLPKLLSGQLHIPEAEQQGADML